MLIDTDDRTVQGPLSDVLAVTYGSVMVVLTDDPRISADEADLTARRLMPLLEQALVTVGLVTRQVSDD